MTNTTVPTKRLVIDSPDTGVFTMAFVDAPAIMVNWFKFSEDKEIKFAIQNEEQRIVFGPALIPNLPIPRTSPDGTTFVVYMDAPTIQQIAIRYAQQGRQNSVNEMHDDARAIDGVTVFESFIVDKNRSNPPKGFESLPEGTWFISAKVNNDGLWAKIKSGEFMGFSIEGFFEQQPVKDLSIEQVEAITESILTQ